VDDWLPTTLLGRLPEPAGVAILRAGREEVFPAKKTLLYQGERGDHVLLLLDGMVKVVARSTKGGDTLLGIRGGGDTVGEMAVLEGHARMATVKSCVPGRARTIDRVQLDQLMTDHPVLAVQIATMMSSRLRRADDRYVGMNSYDSRTRLCRALVDMVRSHGRGTGSHWVLDIQLTQHEIASMVGIKQRTAEKYLADLKADGLVVCGYRAIEVIDMHRLQYIAYGRVIPH
jgi:CRP-like cAMP-binding protein